jgi:hypothetical protein
MTGDVQRAKRQAFDVYLPTVLDEISLGRDATTIGDIAKHLDAREALRERAIAAHVISMMVSRENRAERDTELTERALDRFRLTRIDHDGSLRARREQHVRVIIGETRDDRDLHAGNVVLRACSRNVGA